MVIFFSLVVGVWLYMYYTPEPPKPIYLPDINKEQEWHPSID